MTGKAGRRRRRRGAVGVCGRPLPFPRRHADLSPFSFPHLLLAFYGYSTRRSRPRCEQRSQFSFVHSVQALSFPIRLVWSLALPSSSRIELCCKALSKLLPASCSPFWEHALGELEWLDMGFLEWRQMLERKASINQMGIMYPKA